MNKEEQTNVVMESIERLEYEATCPPSRRQERAVMLLDHLTKLYMLREEVLVNDILAHLNKQLHSGGQWSSDISKTTDMFKDMVC